MQGVETIIQPDIPVVLIEQVVAPLFTNPAAVARVINAQLEII